MSQPTREQIRAGYRALVELGVDVSEAIAEEGLTAPESPAKAEARARLDVVKADRGIGATARLRRGNGNSVTGAALRCLRRTAHAVPP